MVLVEDNTRPPETGCMFTGVIVVRIVASTQSLTLTLPYEVVPSTSIIVVVVTSEFTENKSLSIHKTCQSRI